MAADEYIHHPNGQVTVKGTTVTEASDISVRVSNGATHRGTLHSPDKGFVTTALECSGALTLHVPSIGLALRWVKILKAGTQIPFEFKDPGDRHRVVGVLSEFNWQSSLGNGGVDVNVNWIGKHIEDGG